MAFNKNFVVKNGIEIATDLIYATNDLDKVGLGTTLPTSKLDVIGNATAYGSITADGGSVIATHDVKGTNSNFTGITTIVSGFNVGTGGTALKVIVGSASSVGINTGLPAYSLDVRAGSAQTVGYIDGDLVVNGVVRGTSFDGQVTIGGTLNVSDFTVSGILTASDAEVYTQFDIINNGSAAYQYQSTGIGFTVNRDDPAIYLIRGKNYRFNVNATGYPFYIKTAAVTGTGSRFDRGVEGNGTQVGIITFRVPFNSPRELYYQASNQAGMGSTIYILGESEPLPTGLSTSQLVVNNIYATGVTTLTNLNVTNATITGIATVANFANLVTSGNLSVTGVSTLTGAINASSGINVTGAVKVGSAITANSTGINVVGVVTATSFSGSGSGITGLTNSNLSGSAGITNANLANSTISGVSLGSNLNTLTLSTSGSGLSGSTTYNGSSGSTFTVTSNATKGNVGNTIVYRDVAGNFQAGIVTATLIGNASSASVLQTARTINGVSFNGSANITVEPYIEDDNTNNTRYLTFVDNSTAGYKRLNEDADLNYNPSTNTLNAGNFNSTSDINLKKDIEVITDATSILKQISGVKFSWKENDNKSVGVIAQEIEKVLPEIVGISDKGTRSVNYNGLVGVLIEAVKELVTRVEELEFKNS